RFDAVEPVAPDRWTNVDARYPAGSSDDLTLDMEPETATRRARAGRGMDAAPDPALRTAALVTMEGLHEARQSKDQESHREECPQGDDEARPGAGCRPRERPRVHHCDPGQDRSTRRARQVEPRRRRRPGEGLVD